MGEFHIFISHSSEEKYIAAQIKNNLSICGITAFVAHNDISINEPWKVEIIKNLAICDMMVVLASERSRGSCWVNQEIGNAMNREIPIVSIMLDTNPFGFLSDYQGFPLKQVSTQDGEDDFDYLDCIKNILYPLMRDEYYQTKLKWCFIDAVSKCSCYDNSKFLFNMMDGIPEHSRFSVTEIERIIENGLNNSQIYGSFRARDVIRKFIRKCRNEIDPFLVKSIEEKMS